MSSSGLKILIVYTTAGVGHWRAACALKAAFESLIPGCEAVVVDVLDYANIVFRKMYNRIYLELIKELPEFLGYIYRRYDDHERAQATAKVRLLFDRLNTINLKNLIQGYEPGLIVCTHFLALEIFSDMKRRRKIHVPLYATITDFYPHAFWVYDFVDKYYVANEESRRSLSRRGPKEDGILASGIPIDPVFAALPPKDVAKSKLALANERPTVLILNGGFGVGRMEEIVESFHASSGNLQLLVVAGKNEKLRKKLLRLTRSFRSPTRVFGFVDEIHNLMNAADLMITKPGGLSSAEALASGLPMILVDPVPGQEDRNCEYLLENGVAVRLYDLDDASNKVNHLLQDPAKIGELRRRVCEVAKPQSSLTIAQDIRAHLEEGVEKAP